LSILRFMSLRSGKGNGPILLGEGGVGGGGLSTLTPKTSVSEVSILPEGDSSLDRLKLLRSTTREGQNVDGEEDVLLAAIVAELHGFSIRPLRESELRGGGRRPSRSFWRLAISRPGAISGSRGKARAAARRPEKRAYASLKNLRRKVGCDKQQELTLLPGSNTTELQKKFP